MHRTFFVLLFLAIGLTPDTFAASSDTAAVHIHATIASHIEVGEDLVFGTFVISNEPDPWNYLIHPVEDANTQALRAYAQKEAEPLLWNGYGVLALREQHRHEQERLAAEKQRQEQAAAQSGAAGDTLTP